MSHPSDGALRRMHDEPYAVPGWVGRHHAACERCQGRLQGIAANASFAGDLLAVEPSKTDAGAALTRFRAAAVQPAARRAGVAPRLLERWRATMPARRPALGFGLATLAALTLAVTAWAQPGLLQIFQAKQVQPVTVTRQELQGLPDLSQYGTVSRGPEISPRTVASLAAASAATGLPALAPHGLPGDVPKNVAYQVAGPTWVAFTFDAQKARATAARLHRMAPAMPRNIDGSTIRVDTGAALAEIYGAPAASGQPGIPTLVVIETRAPKVSSTGVSIKELENYLLAQPGVSPQLAAQIRAIGDPSSTLPVPILLGGKFNEQSVTVQGVNGVAIGDSSGLGAGVIWIKHGILYGVGGTISQSEALQIANSL